MWAIKPGNDGNTSTCVEKITLRHNGAIDRWKHLHVRGEDPAEFTVYGEPRETPPRAWRRLQQLLLSLPVQEKHLHVRGED